MFDGFFLNIIGGLGMAAVLLFLPRWLSWLSVRQAYSTHDVMRGEHGFDRAAHAIVFTVLFGLLIWFSIILAPLFREGEVLFWALVVGALLTVAAVYSRPRKRPPSEWHDQP